MVGFWLFSFPPQQINKRAGFRTDLSMQNQRTWDFANHYAGELFIRSGVLGVIGGITSFLFPIGRFEGSILSGLIALYIPYYVVKKTQEKLRSANQ